MQVIDFHTHPYRPNELAPATWDWIKTISSAVEHHGDRLLDPRYVADVLRAEGVERAVVLAEHCPQTSGNVRTESVLEICAEEPDFFIPFASVDVNTDPD